MAETVLSFVLRQLSTFLHEEGRLLGGLRQEVQFIMDELGQMRAFLREAEAKEEDAQPTLQQWIKQVRDAAYDTEDILDEFVARFARRPATGFYGSVRRIFSSIKNLRARHRVASEIQSIKSRIKSISEAHTRYKSDYGISAQASNSLSALLEGDDHQLKVVSVVGMGGLGKTTLVKKVHEDLEVRRHFPVRAWVTSSHGNRVMLTTRKADVASASCAESLGYIHRMEPLSFEDSWTLFCNKIFKGNSCPGHLTDTCLLYTSIYPEDCEIACYRLTNLWIAESYCFDHLRSFVTFGSTDLLLSKPLLSDMFLLKHLNLCGTRVARVPKAIGKLQHLEYLDLGDTRVRELPVEILKLQKLRVLSVYQLVDSSDDDYGFKEIGKLTQLRELGITKLRREDGKELCSSLANLTSLRELIVQSIGKGLCFKAGGFLNLKLMQLKRMEGLRWMRVEEGALPRLHQLFLQQLPLLEELPMGIQHLIQLQRLILAEMSSEMIERVENQKEESEDYRRIAHIPEIVIGSYTDDGEWRQRQLWEKKKKKT
ncbi:unnamed protein product [Coffea canephora]|uniref:Rx N-terminal domain-containing protein n=1 Tax=Coffea canephora TaxID=49390 RepID=A0A068UXE5_COFCA|nr:unnamed protein product [Coffea canephora]